MARILVSDKLVELPSAPAKGLRGAVWDSIPKPNPIVRNCICSSFARELGEKLSDVLAVEPCAPVRRPGRDASLALVPNMACVQPADTRGEALDALGILHLPATKREDRPWCW
jgi:hypothetical protein